MPFPPPTSCPARPRPSSPSIAPGGYGDGRGPCLGGTSFILPGLVVILALSALFLEGRPPRWVAGAAAGTGSAVAAVALNAALGLVPPSWARAGPRTPARLRWTIYAVAGAVAAATVGAYLVLVLLSAGLAELTWRSLHAPDGAGPRATALAWLAAAAPPAGGIGALAWVALKVGGLSYGGGFVIVPLMQADAVHHYHWMTSSQFLNAVALGQVTPGPVVQTVAVVGYDAAKLGGGVLAALIAFAPSFGFILFGGRHFGRIRASSTAQGFLAGAGPAAIGAIAGAAIPLSLALAHVWQFGVLAAALIWLVARRGNVVLGLVGAGVIGVTGSFLGLPVA